MADKNQNLLDFEKICRCCYEKSDDLRSLFREGEIMGFMTTMKEVLEEFTPLTISEDDNLPQKICFNCVIDASRAYIFQNTCIKTDKKLREYLNNTIVELKTKPENDTNEKSQNDEPIYFYDDLEDDDDNGEHDEVTDDTIENSPIEFFLKVMKDENEINDDIQILDDDNESGQTKDIEDATTVYSVIEEHTGDIDEYHTIEDIVDADELDETENMNYSSNTSTVEEILNTSNELKSIESDGGGSVVVQPITIGSSETVTSTTTNPNKSINRKRKQRSRKISGPPYKCEICGKMLSTHSSYNYHMQLHSDKTPFLCSDCGQGFKTRNAYDGHMTLHIGGHKCEICGNSYRQIGSLKSHMLMHTGEKPYLCGICGKGMTQKSGYKKHMLTHTGEKPFQCDICHKEFRYSSNLIAHKRAHSGEKIHTCTVCDKSFVAAEQLKRHSLIHSGERPFECKECGKLFNRKCSLSVHQKLHDDNNRMHICGTCGKSYMQLQALQIHMKIHDSTRKQEVIILKGNAITVTEEIINEFPE